MTENIHALRVTGNITKKLKTWPLVSHAAGGFVRVTYQDLPTLREVFAFRATKHGFQFVAFDEYRILRSGDWEATGKLWRSSDAKDHSKPFLPHGVLKSAMREYLREKTQ